MKGKQGKNGFTLIEILIALIVLAILLGAVTMFFISFVFYGSVARTRLRMQEDIRMTLEYMGRHIRLAGIRPVDVGIETIEESSFVFQTDSNGDGVTERFQFSFDPNTNTIVLRKWVKSGLDFIDDGVPEVVMDNVDQLIFSYYTSSNIETTSPAEVTAVRIDITLSPPLTENERTRLAVGNMKGSVITYCPNLAWRL